MEDALSVQVADGAEKILHETQNLFAGEISWALYKAGEWFFIILLDDIDAVIALESPFEPANAWVLALAENSELIVEGLLNRSRVTFPLPLANE